MFPACCLSTTIRASIPMPYSTPTAARAGANMDKNSNAGLISARTKKRGVSISARYFDLCQQPTKHSVGVQSFDLGFGPQIHAMTQDRWNEKFYIVRRNVIPSLQGSISFGGQQEPDARPRTCPQSQIGTAAGRLDNGRNVVENAIFDTYRLDVTPNGYQLCGF